jgi:aminoglycoside phosphotransferase (APT) family kinase protein
MARQMHAVLAGRFGVPDIQLRPGKGQGNHITFLADHDGKTFFIRIENGPEKDNYMVVEQRLIEAVRMLGIPTVTIYETDATRKVVDFAFQIMEYMHYPDLNRLYKSRKVDLTTIAFEIGRYIATWQSITPAGFGPFDTELALKKGKLEGLHADYPSYFYLNLQAHLDFLAARDFLTTAQVADILHAINSHKAHLHLQRGCLVHKDMALWNLLGTEDEIKAIIDWDDAVSGDPMDDLSLLACFHDQDVIDAALRGYSTVRELPSGFEVRFHLHLLRNMIVKAVIRVGGNYFQKKDDFFLIETGEEGSSLEQMTRDRILDAMEILKNNISPDAVKASFD